MTPQLAATPCWYSIPAAGDAHLVILSVQPR
jgi:hypothetical protein